VGININVVVAGGGAAAFSAFSAFPAAISSQFSGTATTAYV